MVSTLENNNVPKLINQDNFIKVKIKTIKMITQNG